MSVDIREEGGFLSEGKNIDPVSGNEVPPGSSPEEVRDDVDVKLSANEYVVPADVLRYYGMKFFEDLRAKAKDDLANMDAEGRIGGEPMPAEGGEELSPEEMAMLQEVMGGAMNMGGMVGLGNPEFQPGYNQGGTVTPNTPTFNPNQWQDVGSSLSRPTTSATNINVGSYYKTYEGPNGETQLILFSNGKPVTPIPEGFTEKVSDSDTPEEEMTTEAVTPEIGESTTEDRGQEENDAGSWADENYDAIAADPVGFGLEALNGGSGFGQIAGALGLGAIGGVVGAAISVENIAEARASEMWGKDNDVDVTDLTAAIDNAVGNLSPVGRGMLAAGAGTGQNYYESLQERMGQNDPVAEVLGRSGSGSSSSGRSGGGGSDAAAQGASVGVGGEVSTPTESSQSAATEAARGSVSDEVAEGLSGSQSTNPGGFDNEEGTWGSGPMNKGGFVSKRKKKKKTTKK